MTAPPFITTQPAANCSRIGDASSDRTAKAVLLLLCLAMAAITWRKWGDLTIDCGREMYIPAILSRGKRLYFDAWYPYGPLIPYWHSLLFRLFGVHLWILQTAALALVAGSTLITYSLSRFFLPVSLSFVGSFAFLVQAFQLHLFNYIQPYSYPACYGSMMIVVLVWLLIQNSFAEGRWSMFAAGCIAGLEAITKVEFGLAAYILLACAIGMRILRSQRLVGLLKDIAVCVPGVLISSGIYGWYIRSSSLEFMFGENIPVLADSHFVRAFGKQWANVVGFTTDPTLLSRTFLFGLIGVTILSAAIWYASLSRTNAILVVGVAIAICALHIVTTYAEKILHHTLPDALTKLAPLFYFNPGMMFVVAMLSLYVFVRCHRARYGIPESAMLLLAVGALSVGFRALVRIEPTGYSMFYDVLPFIAFLVTVWHLAAWFGAPSSEKLWMGSSAVLCCGLMALVVVDYPLHHRTFLIQTQRGSIYTEARMGRAFQSALVFFDQAAKRRYEKFAVWPEEAALYYFLGESAPSRWYMFTPGVLPPGELTTRYLDDLDRQKVKYIALSNRATPEYGVPMFGSDYNQELYSWLQEHFRIIQTFGDFERRPIPQPWAIQIWERK